MELFSDEQHGRDIIYDKNGDGHKSETKIPTIEDFDFIKPISRGAFGKVFLGHKKGRSEQLYAIKVMKKADMVNKNLTNQVITERDAMAVSSSPFVVQLYYSIQSQQNIFLVMEYMIGGDVKSLLGVAGYFDENMALMYVAEVTLALEYLHSKGIIHRDLKPDNMLITATGHIKLTDFGLSKFNMSNFSTSDVPMTPRTSKTFSDQVDYYRTPGQILSLRSSLAFSTGKFNNSMNSSSMCTPSGKGNSSHTPLSEISNNITSSGSGSTRHTPVCDSLSNTSVGSQPGSDVGYQMPHGSQSHSKLIKQMSLRDKLLTQSTSKLMSQSAVMATPGRLVKQSAIGKIQSETKSHTPVSPFGKPPVKRLMSTLQASLNWTRSTEGDQSKLQSSFDLSDISTVPPNSHPISLSCVDISPDFRCQSESIISLELSSSVFSSTCHSNVDCRDSQDRHDSNASSFQINSDKVLCKCEKDNAEFSENCTECGSHQKAPSRQENITDDTPQMHRTDESVWNSYAAKNLRHLRHGSYSEDTEDSDAVNKENIRNIFKENSPEKPNHYDFSVKCQLRTKNKPRRLTKTKSFCYPSDEESDCGSGRYSDQVQCARKRSFCHVDQSPVRRTHSADSGLTQELRLLRCSGAEPHSKRSNSVPRTRIRFHSGNDRVKSSLVNAGNMEPNMCLRRMIDDSKSVSDSDKMATLSADEKRLVEENSDTSVSDTEKITLSEQKPVQKDIEMNCSDKANDGIAGGGTSCYGMFNHSDLNSQDNMYGMDQIISGARNAFPIVNKMLSHLQKPMASSLNSESDIMTMTPNLSSIYDSDIVSDMSTDMDLSVFASQNSNRVELEKKRSPSVTKSTPQEPFVTPVLPRKHSVTQEKNVHKPLAPPPQPKQRRPSGTKKSPGKTRLRFASATTCIPPTLYADSRSRNDSDNTDVPMTPEPAPRTVVSHASFVKYPHTPKTPLHGAFVRSQSFSHALKTPYRTPKSVRRAPAPPVEEERILGTPDYLAPEILQQKRHGSPVDWWSLGICMFEFLTGVPPFNDQTPDLVFDNILKRDIPWPEGEEALSNECQDAIEALLTMEPENRPQARGVRKMAAFQNIDWHNLLNMEPPFIPEPDNLTDTSYFDARNAMQELFVSDVDF